MTVRRCFFVLVFTASLPVFAAPPSVNTDGQTDDEKSGTTAIPTEDAFGSGAGLTGAVEKTTGVDVNRTSSNGHATFVTIRGGNPRQTNVRFNGLQLRVPSGVGFDIGPWLGTGIDTLLVTRGTGASHESAPLAGSLEFKTQRPQKPKLQLRTLFGSHQTRGLDGRIDIAGPTSGTIAIGRVESTGDFEFEDRRGDIVKRRNNASVINNVVFTMQSDVDDVSIGLYGFLVNSEREIAGPSEFQSQFAGTTSQLDRFGSRFVLSWFPTTYQQLELAAFGQTSDSEYLQPNTLLGSGEDRLSSDYDGAGVTATHRIALDPFQMVTGVQFDRSKYEQQTEDRPILRAQRTDILAWLGTTFRLDPVELYGTVAVSKHTDFDLLLKPSVGASVAIGRYVRADANVAHAQRAPDFDERFLDSDYVRGSLDLVPEKAWNGDLGVRFSTDDVSIGTRGFARLVDNEILFLPVSAFGFAAQNVQDFRVFGSENTFTLKWGIAEFLANYTWTSAPGSGVQRPHLPQHRGSAGLEFTFRKYASIPASISGEIYGRNSVNLDRFGSLQNDGFVSANVMAKFSPSRFVDISVSGRNLFNRLSIQDALQRPVPGREIFVSLQCKLDSSL